MSEKVAVLFTGGKDSSLVAALEALQGREVYLITGDSGIGIKGDLKYIRVKELQERFPDQKIKHITIPTYSLFRDIAIKNIEDDFRRWEINLILMGDKLAIHAAAIAYCLKNGINRMVDGVVNYQSELVEQKKVAMDMLKELGNKYGVRYESPIYNYGGKKDVKYSLLSLGLSNKSLEGVSIFGDSFSEPTDEIVREYIDDKIPHVYKYIKLMTKTDEFLANACY